MIELSPGLAQSAFELLGLVGRQGLTVEAVISGLARIGGIASADALAVAQELNWIEAGDDALLHATKAGARVIDEGAYAGMLRLTLLDHATLLSPPWLQNARMGRSRTLAFAPIGIRQLLVEAGVAEGVGDEVVIFWDRLGALARGQRDERLNAIGRSGERLSLRLEAERTGLPPRWASIESNADGYDILSVVDRGDRRPLSIEVKSSMVGLRGNLVLTRHEWDIACDAAAHRFDLWDLSQDGAPRFASAGVDAMRAHMPTDHGAGVWEEVVLPFSAFSDHFAEPSWAEGDSMVA